MDDLKACLTTKDISVLDAAQAAVTAAGSALQLDKVGMARHVVDVVEHVRERTEYRFEHREGGAFAVACSSPTGNQAHGNFRVGLAGQVGSEHYRVITFEQFDKALGGFLTCRGFCG